MHPSQIIEKYMKIAIEEAKIAKENGENPFGAVLLDKDYNFCHKAHSKSIELSDPTAHAEVLVIREYCQKTNKVYLNDYILICSGEPCIMCSGAIKWAKIDKIYYSVPQSEINKASGGKVKPSCESLINSGYSQKEIHGNILLEEGLKVFEKFEFTPQDTLNIKIRLANEEDYPQISSLKLKGWQTAFKGIVSDEYLESMSYEEVLNKYKTYDTKSIYVVEKENKIIAFCRIYDYKEPVYEDEKIDCEIREIYIEPSLKRKGIGSKLFRYVVNTFRENKKKRLYLGCFKENYNSRKFYEKMGGQLKESQNLLLDKEYPMIAYIFELK